MTESPNKEKGAVVRCSVYSDGKAVGAAFRMISIRIEKAVNRIGKATLVYEAGDMPSASVPESDDDTFAVGQKIRIEAGYDEDESPLFEGIVVSHGLEIGAGNEGMLRIECRDYAFPMTLGRRSRVFADSTDSAAISAIIGGYSTLSPSVGSSSTEYGELVQYYCSDWDFILSLADRNGWVVITEGDKISVKIPEVSGSSVLSLTYGPDIVSFQAEVAAYDQLAGIGAIAWDPDAQKIISAEGSAPALNDQGSDDAPGLGGAVGVTPWKLQTVCGVDSEELAHWADALWLKAGMARIQGTVSFSGSPKVKAGTILELDGFGKRFNGNAYVGSVEHGISEGEWTTTAGMGIPAEPITERANVTAPPVSGLLPGVQGLHIGKVTQLDEDPKQNNRIQVEIPTLNGDNNTVWARLASGWAGSGYGSFLIPDVGDEVVLGFFNNDPCYPVILGSLYSSSRKGPYELTADNFTRALVTKEGMKALFDEEKKVITVETPGGNRIVISDEAKGISLADQNDNKVAMNDSGISIHSPKDIILKSDKNIKIQAGMGLEMKASSDLKLKGMNVEVKADAGLTAKGTATAEFSASGNTTIKGAMVMIN